MNSKLSIYHIRNAELKHLKEFNKWQETCFIYTQSNLLPKHFDKSGKTLMKFSFTVKWLNYPLVVKANDYLSARLKFWTVLRSKKHIKNLSYFHDRLIQKIEVSEVSDASLIGLSNVSILQQSFES